MSKGKVRVKKMKCTWEGCEKQAKRMFLRDGYCPEHFKTKKEKVNKEMEKISKMFEGDC